MIQKCVFFRLQKTPGFQATTWPRAWLVKTWWELTKTLRAETSTTAPRSAATCVNEGAMSRSVGCLQVTGNTADPIWAPASLRFTQPPTALEFHRSGQQLCKGDSAGTRLCSSCRCCCAVPCRAALRCASRAEWDSIDHLWSFTERDCWLLSMKRQKLCFSRLLGK